MPKTILYDEHAMAKLKLGIDTVANAVKVTLGARGRNVIIDNYMLQTQVTKDGVTVARNIGLADPIENVGASMVRDVALKVLDEVGDATTTACVLTQAIFNEGMKLVAAGVNPMDLKKGIDAAVEQVVGQIKDMSKTADDEMLKQVATVSANNDPAIGELVADAYSKITKDGIITIEDSGSTTTEIKVVDGMQIKQGFISPYYINNPVKMSCEMKNPVILIYDRTITVSQEIIGIFNKAGGKPLLIICADLEGEAFATLNVNRMQNNINVCAIKAPSYGERRNEILQDLAILTDGTVVADQQGLTLERFEENYFGTCDSVSITKDTTTIVNGHGERKNIQQRITELRTFAVDSKGVDKKSLEERAAKLSGGVAVMYVGGTSKVEINEKKDRCDDAVRATKAALEEGVVPGGGYAFLSCSLKLWGNNDQVAGMQLIAKAIESPLRQICKNAGIDDGYIIGKCRELSQGYNVVSEQFEDLVATGIVDPAKVCRVSLEQAASVAGTLLTSSVMMVEINEEKK